MPLLHKVKWKENAHFFLVKFSHCIWGANSYILPIFLKPAGNSQNLFLNVLNLQRWIFCIDNAVNPWSFRGFPRAPHQGPWPHTLKLTNKVKLLSFSKSWKWVSACSFNVLLAYFYTTKINRVCVCIGGPYVCMSSYAFRHALRYGAETWHGGRGQAHKVCAMHYACKLITGDIKFLYKIKYFPDRPTRLSGRYVTGIKQLFCHGLSNAIWPPDLVGRTPDQSVMHYWGQRSCRSHPR